MTASFSQLQLHPHLAQAVAEMGYESMTPIQEQAIPVVLQGRDVMGAAQTGTGKTAAFSLPLLQRMMVHENTSTSPARHPVRALVLLPTRELADQVAQQIKLYAKYTKLRSAVVFGGMDMKPQTAELKAGVEVTDPKALAAALDPKATIKFIRIKNSWGSDLAPQGAADDYKGFHDLFLPYLNGPIKECTGKDTANPCSTSRETAGLRAFVLPPPAFRTGK